MRLPRRRYSTAAAVVLLLGWLTGPLTPLHAPSCPRTAQQAHSPAVRRPSPQRGAQPPQRPTPPRGQTFTVTATAYCLRGTTASGRPAGPGVAAVDPRVIPLGTRFHVEGHGWVVAADTGGAIRGRRIDIWLPSRSGCLQWGRRSVRVHIPHPPR